MTLFDGLRRLDRIIVETTFQPVHDWVAEKRQCSDHLIVIVLTLVGAGIDFGGDILDPPDNVAGFVITLGIVAIVFFMLLGVWMHGTQFKNSGAPGVYAGSWFIRLIYWPVLFSGWLLIHTLFAEPGLEVALNAVGWVALWAAWFFGACTLKRPPPPKPKEEFAMQPSAT